MKSFIVLLACVAIAKGGLVAPHLTGHSTQHRSQDIIGNYNFGYNEGHATGGTFRQEAGDKYGNKVGSYGLQDIDGRVRTVKYVADGLGFRAHISTNEPGTAAGGSAATIVNGPVAVKALAPAVAAPIGIAGVGIGHAGLGLGGYAHSVAHAAPLVAKAAIAAPVAVAAPIGLAGAYGGYGAGLGAYGAGLGAYGGYGLGVGAYGLGIGHGALAY